MQPIGENTTNIPAFLGKLWKMVNDPSTDHLICWSPAGNSFVIQNQAHFWYELLPLYYKHNNMSSFVRQLNMYGFHKMSTVENGTMDSDKDEIQFYHPYFQKGQPGLLRMIKRKVTTSKTTENNVQNILKQDDIVKVLTDVKQLKGRQSNLDSQLSAMKQENAVLWRELALLRQKHIKQQQIVNKLIQFLVTLVQPSATSRIGVGVKRRMPLMLHESPVKKMKPKNLVTNNDSSEGGPIIHELDNEIDGLPEELLEEEISEPPMVTSPGASTPATNSAPTNASIQPSAVSPNRETNGVPGSLWDKPDFVDINQMNTEDLLLTNEDLAEESINTLQSNVNQASEKVFLNPTARDTLLSNLINGSYNANILNMKSPKKNVINTTASKDDSTVNNDNNSDMTVATRDMRITNGTLGTNDFYRDDFDLHLEHTQSEIDQLKDLLHGCNSLDANALLGFFNDDNPLYGLPCNQNKDCNTGDPMVSGTELATYGNNVIDFNELF
ncbi:hypothetical protein NQ317_012014 [Molorchus minor]|uniref:HSF-type DNA-binding domain-containing protein n=1 Tax=Molorchus minor TaxID=1323400 RepID=A0ABQ9JYW2_9CUCU|nr:hypothetical protein NQ317_012014 [Molorchus minor]